MLHNHHLARNHDQANLLTGLKTSLSWLRKDAILSDLKDFDLKK